MEFIERERNTERTYSVYFDQYEMKDLLDSLVENIRYTTQGTFEIPKGTTFDFKRNTFYWGESLPNGDPPFENIHKVTRKMTKIWSSVEEVTKIEGTKITVPKLAYILHSLLTGFSNNIYDFLNYENHEDLVPIKDRIEKAEEKVNQTNIYDFDEHIKAVEELRKVCKERDEGHFFDVPLLKNYYQKARDLMTVQLVSEKIYRPLDTELYTSMDERKSVSLTDLPKIKTLENNHGKINR